MRGCMVIGKAVKKEIKDKEVKKEEAVTKVVEYVLTIVMNSGVIYKINYSDIKQAEKKAESLIDSDEKPSTDVIRFKNGNTIYLNKNCIDSLSIYPAGKERYTHVNAGIEKKMDVMINESGKQSDFLNRMETTTRKIEDSARRIRHRIAN